MAKKLSLFTTTIALQNKNYTYIYTLTLFHNKNAHDWEHSLGKSFVIRRDRVFEHSLLTAGSPLSARTPTVAVMPLNYVQQASFFLNLHVWQKRRHCWTFDVHSHTHTWHMIAAWKTTSQYKYLCTDKTLHSFELRSLCETYVEVSERRLSFLKNDCSLGCQHILRASVCALISNLKKNRSHLTAYERGVHSC